MEQDGEYLIAASRQEVWEALNDPDVLGACIPGCQEITRTDETHFSARVKAKVGPVSATFTADMELTDLNPPASYVIVGGVKGGAAGFGKGEATVSLAEESADNVPATRLTYQVKASVGGKLAQVGSRLVDGAARKMADDFFGNFSARLAPAPAPSGQTDTSENQTQTAGSSPAPDYEPSGRGFVWIIAFVVLILAMVLAF